MAVSEQRFSQTPLTPPEFRWRPSVARSFVGAPTVGLLPAGFVILYGARSGNPLLATVTLAAYVVFTVAVCTLIARTHVTVSHGTLTVRRIRTRRVSLTDVATIIVVSIAYPGLRTQAGVPTALLFDSVGTTLLKVPMRTWSAQQVNRFTEACHPRATQRVNETLTPKGAIQRWPNSFSSRSQWRGYCVLAAILLGLLAFSALMVWVVVALPSPR